jgi:hypothetical protein
LFTCEVPSDRRCGILNKSHYALQDRHFRALTHTTNDICARNPGSWALITGDILTNLRAALDHSNYPHLKCRKPALPDFQIQFPIVDDETAFDSKRCVTDRHFDTPVLAELRSDTPLPCCGS